jgi:hypothetical protein
MPSYFFFQLKYVAWLIPAFRQMSATGTPSAPCRRMNAFCASETYDAFIVFRSSQPKGKYRGKTLTLNGPLFGERITSDSSNRHQNLSTDLPESGQ